MKLLVLAQIPPPVHGQSVMVRTLVDGLAAHGVAIHHVNLPLSRDASDIGRWRFGKIFRVLAACAQAVWARFAHGCDTLYYVPAPAKRGALYRDWVVMLICRPFFRRVVLHWHAFGLGHWLATQATALERTLSRLLLGRVSLSIVLAESLRADAAALDPREIAVVANGIADPGEPPALRSSLHPFQVLFLGLCSEEKGLFTAFAAVIAANAAAPAPANEARVTLVVAGPFPDQATRIRFEELCHQHPTMLRYVGPVHGAAKTDLLRTSHCLCLPTRYPAEGQPLVLLEAMAHDLPVIATRWRAIPDTLPPEAMLVDPGDATALAGAITRLMASPPPAGVFRRHYLGHFTTERHLARFADALATHLRP